MNYNLKLALKEPTRLISKTCIDNFAHNFPKTCRTEVLELALSDHTAQLLTCPVKNVPVIKFWRKKYRDFCIENISKFRDCLMRLSFSEVYDTDDPNAAFSTFMDYFKLFYDLCFPFKLITIFVTRKPKWVSKGVRLCSKKKRRLLWNYRLKPTKTNKEIFIKYNKLYKKIIRLTQRAQNDFLIKNSKNKSKSTWSIINNTRLNIPKDHILEISDNDEMICNPEQIANNFNNYFINRITPASVSSTYGTSTLENTRDSFFMAPSVPKDILLIIKNLKNTNSEGHDGISTKIVKSVGDLISGHLSFIINLSILSGIYPDMLKTSIVKPLFKKGNRLLMNNYRPIALNPVMSKIYEKYIYKEMYTYLERKNIFCQEQNGFRQNKNINKALFEFLNNVISNMDKRNPISAIYCDMTQAFDHVKHDILLKKLDAYGIRGNILKLIESYLVDRKQYTVISQINPKSGLEEHYCSETRIVKYGVPQGSTLGPLFFNVYINDLPKSVNCPITLFADDSTLTIPCNDPDIYEYDIKNSLTSVISWLDNNNLKINLEKTQLMTFKQRINNDRPLKIDYQNFDICEVESAKFLDLPWLSISFYMAGKLMSSFYFNITYMFTSELFPTYTRNSMHALCSSLGRIGSMLAPQTPLLMHYWSGLPPIVFGGASLVAGLVTFLVPDTAENSLPNTVKEAEALGNDKTSKNKTKDGGEINLAFTKEDTGLNLVVNKEAHLSRL
ncbi:hypothetical protein evm_007686 [Chilo suppressalis]|nr:hypothetical protein evm_007686 [Chilo suppressalis]